jgi:hypothetical protein
MVVKFVVSISSLDVHMVSFPTKRAYKGRNGLDGIILSDSSKSLGVVNSRSLLESPGH